ncbi:unnamed protein product [Rotaria sp. Silwood2]|nr:unnamed protein product [Rotaria sp. Silwood2]CAF3140205.1 unnamed protein product [Rotaria sp. Silwood2]CAF3304962.1 unnamed protein product [Rotaria sp. Silwood2]CAF4111745.1 unnamed protein product [Rotaria sp. Silwood2]CAF4201271.1 unnamed protein product [Rotaria sp. Silwood2]
MTTAFLLVYRKIFCSYIFTYENIEILTENFFITTSCYFGEDLVNLADGGYRCINKLQVDDRIWSLDKDGKTFVEDEMILIMHAESNSSNLFYVFTTINSHSLSLSGNRNIAVFNVKLNKTIYIRASKVTIEHQLIMPSGIVAIQIIRILSRMGFYSALIVIGNLLVNNILTLVNVDSYRAIPETLH